LLDAYQFARRNLVAKLEALGDAEDALYDATRELTDHIRREGNVGDGLADYSLDEAGRLRWKRKPTEPAGWRRYAAYLPPKDH
jgi:hypothetical protein